MEKPTSPGAPHNDPSQPSDPSSAAPKRRSTWKLILAALALILLALVAIIALQPADFRIERSTTIAAPIGDVFPQVNDFHNWKPWNPWGKLDPNMKETFEGTPQGLGTAYAWVGNSDVGEGRMSIAESRKDEYIRVRLQFIKPFEALNWSTFTFKPEGEATNVTWAMYGPKDFLAKAMHLFMDMDAMIGDQFDKGLADLKATVEKK